MEKRTYVIIYDLDNRKLNNDLRVWLSSNISRWDGWRYYKDYQKRERIVIVKLNNKLFNKLKEDSEKFRGDLWIEE